MAIRNSALYDGYSSRRRYVLPPVKRSLTGAIVAIYAICAAISTAWAQDHGQCLLEPARLNTLEQASHGYFKAMRLAADQPFYAGDLTFQDEQGATLKLSSFRGKTLLVNLWAVWCAPCREEMPELAELKTKMGGADFDVLAINIDRSNHEVIKSFLQEAKAGNLALYRDQTMEIFQDVRRQGLARGLPVTLVIDPQGCLLASYNGSAPWANEDALTFIRAAVKAGH